MACATSESHDTGVCKDAKGTDISSAALVPGFRAILVDELDTKRLDAVRGLMMEFRELLSSLGVEIGSF